MNVLKFFVNNWQDILVVLVLIASGIIFIKQWIKKNGPMFDGMTALEKAKYVAQLLANLVPITLALVTDAEINFGGGTGVIKRSWVIDQLYLRIPDEFKKYVTEEDLSNLLEKVLEEAKKLWESNRSVAALIEPERIL